VHIKPTTDLAERVLLPGDPGRALLLAQALLEAPKMFNHNRGLWGYTGASLDDGEPLTIQSTGMGGPSAAIVLSELADLGVRRAVRVGTCGALNSGLALGDLVVAGEALAADGTSRALGAPDRVSANASLTRALGESSLVASTDLFYDDEVMRFAASGAVAVEMESAALFRVGELRGVAVGSVLAVSDVLSSGSRQRLDEDELTAAGERVGRAGAAALRRDGD
jgi:uridine phosphorylase